MVTRQDLERGGRRLGRLANVDARARGRYPIAHRRSEHGDHPPVDDLDSRRGELSGEPLHQALHLARADRSDGSMTDGRIHVPAEMLLDGLRCPSPVDLNLPPLLGEGL